MILLQAMPTTTAPAPMVRMPALRMVGAIPAAMEEMGAAPATVTEEGTVVEMAVVTAVVTEAIEPLSPGARPCAAASHLCPQDVGLRGASPPVTVP